MTEQLIKLIAFEKLPQKTSNRVKINHSQPNNFNREGVRNFTHVYAPSYPHIEQAYEKAGKSIFRLDEKDVPKTPEIKREEIIVQDEPEQTVSEDFDIGAEVIDTTLGKESEEYASDEPIPAPSQWRELSWPKLRSLAKHYTEEPVKSKEQAEEIMLEAESANRL